MSKINGIETEWTVLQRQLGNLPELEEEEAEGQQLEEAEEDVGAVRKAMDLKQLSRELEAHTLDDEEERELEALKQLRLRELREKAERQKQHATRYTTIGAADYATHVTEASERTWVVCHLYSDGKEECKLLDQVLKLLSEKHLDTRFVRIQASVASPNFPDRNCPTLLCYHEGTVKMQFTRLSAFGGLAHTNWRTVEWALSACGAVHTTMTEPPKGAKGARTKLSFVGKRDKDSASIRRNRGWDDEDDEDSYDDSSSDEEEDDDDEYDD